jgi:hypothetical protein
LSISRRSFIAGASALAVGACGSDSVAPPPIGGNPTPVPTPSPTPTPAPTPTTSFAQPFDDTATALDANLEAITAELVLINAKAHDYRVSLIETDTDLIRMHIWDEQIGRQVASFQLNNPDYNNLPERILLNSSNPLNSRQFSGIQGWLKLNASAIEVSPAVHQFSAPESSRINRSNVSTRTDYTNRETLDDFDEVIAIGAGLTHPTLRSALEKLYDGGPLANQSNPNQLPVCLRANPFHRIALAFEPGLYTGESEHLPDWVYIGGRVPDTVTLEHTPGATSALIEGQANTGAFDMTLRNTARNGPQGTARYAWHTDYVHLVQTPDSEGDVNRDYAVIFEGVRFAIGPDAAIQSYGAGIGVQAKAKFNNCIFDCENSSYLGPLASANNSSGSIGGGRFDFSACADVSGRASSTPTLAVQSKTDATNPNVVEVNDCTGFATIALSPGNQGVFKGKWILRGNTPMVVSSTIPGDNLTG